MRFLGFPCTGDGVGGVAVELYNLSLPVSQELVSFWLMQTFPGPKSGLRHFSSTNVRSQSQNACCSPLQGKWEEEAGARHAIAREEWGTTKIALLGGGGKCIAVSIKNPTTQ